MFHLAATPHLLCILVKKFDMTSVKPQAPGASAGARLGASTCETRHNLGDTARVRAAGKQGPQPAARSPTGMWPAEINAPRIPRIDIPTTTITTRDQCLRLPPSRVMRSGTRHDTMPP